MSPEKRAVVERALKQVGDALAPEDRASVVTFGLRQLEIQSMRSRPLMVTLASRPGGTSIVDALLLSLVTAPSTERRQLGLFMTDGDDTTSYFDLRTAIETAKYSTGQSAIVIVRERDELNNGQMLTLFRSVAGITGGEMIELKRGDDSEQGVSHRHRQLPHQLRASLRRHRRAGTRLARRDGRGEVEEVHRPVQARLLRGCEVTARTFTSRISP